MSAAAGSPSRAASQLAASSFRKRNLAAYREFAAAFHHIVVAERPKSEESWSSADRDSLCELFSPDAMVERQRHWGLEDDVFFGPTGVARWLDGIAGVLVLSRSSATVAQDSKNGAVTVRPGLCACEHIHLVPIPNVVIPDLIGVVGDDT